MNDKRSATKRMKHGESLSPFLLNNVINQVWKICKRRICRATMG